MKKEKIIIYWDDIKKYYNGKKKIKPTSMYTEGVLALKRKDFLIIESPETLNLEKVKNHPEKKPKFYAIPLGLIKEIKEIK